jgi:hypothetical protein
MTPCPSSPRILSIFAIFFAVFGTVRKSGESRLPCPICGEIPRFYIDLL